MSAPAAIVVRAALGRWAKLPGLTLDVQLPGGLAAIVGTPADGLLALAPLIAGVQRERAFAVSVLGRDPSRDPLTRARVGATFQDPVLLDAPTVGGLLAEVDALRGGDAAARSLERFALSSWRDRRLALLGRSERRALELAIALSTPNPLAIVLTEPTVDVAGFDRELLARALAQAAEAGACVVVASGSTADAVSLAPVVHLLERGRLGDATPIDQLGALVWRGYPSLRVEVDLPRLLVTALTDDPAVTGVAWDDGNERSIVIVHGRELEPLALAVAAAVSHSGVSLRSLIPMTPDLDQIRGRASGLALAAYHAGYQAYWAHWQRQAPTGADAPGAT